MTSTEVRLDAHGQQVLDEETCRDLIEHEKVGRVAFVEGGKPSILPVCHALDDGAVVFQTTSGSKLDFARRAAGSEVAFEVDGFDERTGAGWSVLVKGEIHPVLDLAEARRLDDLGVEPWPVVIDSAYWMRVEPLEISGRRILRPEAP